MKIQSQKRKLVEGTNDEKKGKRKKEGWRKEEREKMKKIPNLSQIYTRLKEPSWMHPDDLGRLLNISGRAPVSRKCILKNPSWS